MRTVSNIHRLLLLLVALVCLPLCSQAADEIVISSKTDWQAFTNQYSGKEVVVHLETDLSLTDKDVCMESFVGELDGQGHTININFTQEGYNRTGCSIFYKASGTIRNLNIDGTITRNYSNQHSAPLVYQVADCSLTIERCNISVQTVTASGKTYFSNAGGFIARVQSGASVAFSDCSFTGSFTANQINASGGYVGWLEGGNVTIDNCYCDLTSTSVVYAETNFGYFVGLSWSAATLTVNNSYAHAYSKITNTDYTVSDVQVESGEVTYKLNAGRTGDNAVWRQTLGTDNMPMILALSPESREVFHSSGSTLSLGSATWATLYPPRKIALPVSAKTYTMTDVRDGHAILSETTGNIIGKPVVVYCKNGIGNVVIPEGYINMPVQSGLLRGVAEATTAQDGWYVLNEGNSTGAFEPADASTTVRAWQCYLSDAALTLPSYVLWHEEDSDLPGDNLVNNGDFCNGMHAWTLQAGSQYSFDIDNATPGIKEYFHTGKWGAIIGQEIDLTKKYTAEELDASPNAYFSIDYCCTLYLTSEEIIIKYLDANGETLKETKHISRFNADDVWGVEPWQTYQSSMVLPVGTRKVKIEVNGGGTGSDKVDGPGFDNVTFILRPAGEELPMHTITVTTNKGTEDTYGSGTYWEGSTVIIGTNHQSPNLHSCNNAFAGYKGESNPDLSTTQRTIIVGNTDATYKAIFIQAEEPMLSGYAFGIENGETFDGPKIFVPKGYTGTPSFSCSNTSVATIDATTGKITPQASQEGMVTVAVKLPADGNYKATTLFYNLYIANSITQINSKSDWTSYVKNTNKNEAEYRVVRLNTDLSLDNDDAPVTYFNGMLDGQGHTINVSFTDDDNHSVLTQAKGAIKDLNITGTCCFDQGDVVHNESSPLVYKVSGKINEYTDSLLIENCQSSATLKVIDTPSLGANNSFAGGFVGVVDRAAKLTFRDCAYSGKFTGDELWCMGGFLGCMETNRDTVYIHNSYSDCTGSESDDVKSTVGYFIGRFNAINSAIYVNNSCARKVTNITLQVRGEDVYSDSYLATGRIGYKQKGARTGDEYCRWAQTIGTDAGPKLKAYNKSSLEVFRVEAYDYDISAAGWGTLFYPAVVSLPSGVKAYTTNEVSDGVLVLKDVGATIPARTPVIICTLAEGEDKAEAMTLSLNDAYYNKVKYDGTGMLKGVYERTAAPNGSYIMQNHGGNVAFYQVDTSVNQPYVPAWRCYLELPAEQQSYAKINLSFASGETTGIDNAIEPLLRDGAVYDLQGRRVHSLRKNQIYIKNGRKFIVR